MRNDKISNVCQEINWFKEGYNQGIISKNLIQRLYQSLDESLDYDNYVMNFYRYVPYLSYLIERNVQNHNKSEKQRLKQLFVTTDITEEKN